jgi:hypothetical protein
MPATLSFPVPLLPLNPSLSWSQPALPADAELDYSYLFSYSFIHACWIGILYDIIDAIDTIDIL